IGIGGVFVLMEFGIKRIDISRVLTFIITRSVIIAGVSSEFKKITFQIYGFTDGSNLLKKPNKMKLAKAK
ncbi:MAG TPA: hypothetical protein VLN46_03795, partial [Gillisia sp.]|nr:hypothetical protein [Gillisia sp.]